MNFFPPILILLSLIFSNPYEATVYLNDGTIIRGTIIEEKPNFYIQIRSGGRDLVYQPFEIKKIVRESSTIYKIPSIDTPTIIQSDLHKLSDDHPKQLNTESKQIIDESISGLNKESRGYTLSINTSIPSFLSNIIDPLYDANPGLGLKLVTPLSITIINKNISIFASVNKSYFISNKDNILGDEVGEEIESGVLGPNFTANSIDNIPKFNPLLISTGFQTDISIFNFMYGFGIAFNDGDDWCIFKINGISYSAPLNINNDLSALRYSLDIRSVSIDGMPYFLESNDWTSWVDIGFSIIYPFSLTDVNDSLDKQSTNQIRKSVKKNKLKYKTTSLGIGLSSNKNLNLVQLTKDFKLFKNGGLFIAIGFPNFYAVGLTIQEKYNNTGIIAGVSRGQHDFDWLYTSFSLAHQWRIQKSNTFFSIGIGVNSFKDEWYNGDYLESDTYIRPYPIISIDTRF